MLKKTIAGALVMGTLFALSPAGAAEPPKTSDREIIAARVGFGVSVGPRYGYGYGYGRGYNRAYFHDRPYYYSQPYYQYYRPYYYNAPGYYQYYYPRAQYNYNW